MTIEEKIKVKVAEHKLKFKSFNDVEFLKYFFSRDEIWQKWAVSRKISYLNNWRRRCGFDYYPNSYELQRRKEISEYARKQ